MSSLLEKEIDHQRIAADGWAAHSLGQLGVFLKGSGIRRDQAQSGNIPCVRYGEIYTTHHNIVRDFHSHISTKVSAEATRLHSGDLLFAGSGETKEDIGKCVAFVGHEEAYAGGDIIILRPKGVNSAFLGYLLNAPQVARQKASRGQGDAVVHISAAALGSIRLELPKIDEQERIATALNDIDDLIASFDALIAKKRDIKQAAMQQLLTGKRRLAGFQEEWVNATLGQVAEIVGGGTPSSKKSEYWNDGIPWCTPSDLTGRSGRILNQTDRTISEAGLKSSAAKLLPKGALLLCTRATIGEVKIAGQPVCTNQGFQSLVCRSDVSNRFIYYLLNTLTDRMKEKASGSTFLEISKKKLATVDAKIPSSSQEQEAIASVLWAMDDEIEALHVKYEKMQKLRDGMMKQLLTGRIRLV